MIKKNGTEITSKEIWEELAGPVRKVQWKELRSAMEVSKAWMNNGDISIPQEIVECIVKHEDFSEIVEWEAEPEFKSYFDSFGGPANLDLIGQFTDSKGKYLIGVEAKADEPYSEFNIQEKFAAALEHKIKTPNSMQIERIIGLAKSLFHEKKKSLPKISSLKYQLLTGLAGTISKAEKEGIKRVIFLIHEFKTNSTDPKKHEINSKALNAFIHRITNGKSKSIQNGELLGPIKIPGTPLFDKVPDMYIGKVVRTIN